MAVSEWLACLASRKALHACLVGFSFTLACCLCSAATPWVTLQGGQYLIKRPNDGDSFHVSVTGHEYIFRLYFVDAPETRTDFRDRVEEQARYFDTTLDQLLKIGELAKQFTREKLRQPFLVRTCWEDAMGRSRMQRFYAFVQTQTGDLGEQLVENGLARIHGATAKPEGLVSAEAEWRALVRLEKKARQERVGGWGVNQDRLFVRAQGPQSEKGVDPFDKFFHPAAMEQASITTPAGAVAEPSSLQAEPVTTQDSSASGSTKLNVNTASKTELENVSGIGPVLADRIIAARPLKSADELRTVKGIGDVTYARIRAYFQ